MCAFVSPCLALFLPREIPFLLFLRISFFLWENRFFSCFCLMSLSFTAVKSTRALPSTKFILLKDTLFRADNEDRLCSTEPFICQIYLWHCHKRVWCIKGLKGDLITPCIALILRFRTSAVAWKKKKISPLDNLGFCLHEIFVCFPFKCFY